MNIKELKELIKDLPDDMRICGSDFVGELCEADIYISNYKEDGIDEEEVLLVSLD